MINTWRSQVGVTLIELVIAVFVTSVVVLSAYTILATTQKAVVANEATADTQQNTRIAMDLIVNDIKMAGFSMTAPIGNCTTAIVPNDQANASTTDRGPDSIQILVPTTNSSGTNAWKLNGQAASTSTGISTITLQTGARADMASAGMVNGSQVSINGVVTATVGSSAGETITFSPPIPPPAIFPSGTQVYLLQCINYRVSNSTAANECNGPAPCLMRGVVGAAGVSAEAPIVEGIEDIQFKYACDGCTAFNGSVPDGMIDNQPSTAAGFDEGDFVSDSTWSTSPMTPDKIRLVQVSVVGRQLRQDQGLGEASGSGALTSAPLQVADHRHSDGLFGTASTYNAATYPQYRRRLLTKTVETRNVEK